MCVSRSWEQPDAVFLFWDADGADLTTASTAEVLTTHGKSGK